MRFTTPLILLSASLTIAAPLAQTPAPAAVTPPSFNDISQATNAKIAQEGQKAEAAKEKNLQQGDSGSGSSPLSIFDTFFKPFTSILGGGGLIPKRALTHTQPIKRQLGGGGFGGFLNPLSAVESLFSGVGGGSSPNGAGQTSGPGQDVGKGFDHFNPAAALAPAPAQQ